MTTSGVTPRAAAAAVVATALGLGALRPPATPAMLDEPGFRAVPVAQSDYPIAAVAVAPDGRLFAAVQALGQTNDSEPGLAEIRVYETYASNDGAVLDRGTVWATVDGVRATTISEGLLGIALAPDFATSGLVYVYLTTTDGNGDQQVRVYRETAAGIGEYLGAAATALEPPTGSASRNGGGLVFGVDGCLYVGVGDNASPNRWNSQVLSGTDTLRSSERTAFCLDVCLGPVEYPTRSTDNGLLNHAGKILRFDVEGAAPAEPGTAPALPAQPFAFGTGLGDPTALAAHPLTGQLFVAEGSDLDQAELAVVDAGTNHGWPCLEGAQIPATTDAACLAGFVPDDVYANHPVWRRPLATHGGDPVLGGPAAYTGRGYPAEYYGDVFYLLRQSARIYRLDLEPPCFLPDPGGVTPSPVHDSDNDGDFRAFYDADGDGELDDVGFTNLVTLVQAANPLGQEVLYVVGRRHNSNSLDADAIVFRLEYATAFTPYAGPAGRVPASCFTDGPYSGGGVGTVPYRWENPFLRPTCLPPGGVCSGAPDGTPCDDGEPCNGEETCTAGSCRDGAPLADGVACDVAGSCRAAGQCRTGGCELGAVVADGTPCPDADPCNGFETCVAGTCEAGDGPGPLAVGKLVVKRGPTPGSDALLLSASVEPVLAIAPHVDDDVAVELHGGPSVHRARVGHPASNPGWRGSRPPGTFVYRDPTGSADGVTAIDLVRKKTGTVAVRLKAKRLSLADVDGTAVRPRLVIGEECFEVDLSASCRAKARKLVCGP